MWYSSNNWEGHNLTWCLGLGIWGIMKSNIQGKIEETQIEKNLCKKIMEWTYISVYFKLGCKSNLTIHVCRSIKYKFLVHTLPEAQQWLLVLSLSKLTVDSLLFFPLIINNYYLYVEIYTCYWIAFCLVNSLCWCKFQPYKGTRISWKK